MNEIKSHIALENIVDFESREEYFYVKYKVDTFDIHTAKQLIEFFKEKTNHTPGNYLIDATSIVYLDKEVVHFLAESGSDFCITTAVVMRNIRSIIYNFIYFFINPNVECKAFSTEELATKWLLHKIKK